MLNSKILTALAAAFIAVVTLASCNLHPGDKSKTHYAAVKLVGSDRWSIIDVNSGENIHRDEFKNQPSAIVGDKFCVKNNERLYDYFSVDNVTKPINKESYVSASAFNENGIAVATPKGKAINVINDKCETITTLSSSIKAATNFYNGHAIITTSDDMGGYKYGFINEKGETAVKPVYDKVLSVFSEDGIALMAKYNAKYKVDKEVAAATCFAIDTTGKVLFSFSLNEYYVCSRFVNGYLAVKNPNGEAFLLDKQGKRAFSIGKWDDDDILSILGVYDNMVEFEQGGSFGLKDMNGKTAIQAKYDNLMSYNWVFVKGGEYQDLNNTKKDGRYGLINNKDEVKIPFTYAELYPWNNNLLLAGNGDSFILIDLNGKEVFRENFTDITMESIINTTYVISDIPERQIE